MAAALIMSRASTSPLTAALLTMVPATMSTALFGLLSVSPQRRRTTARAATRAKALALTRALTLRTSSDSSTT
jgi:hypothetical protein